jgi:hypothetical protein
VTFVGAKASVVLMNFQMIKKASVVVFLGLLLTISFHKAVADELSPLPTLPSENKEIINFECENLASRLQDMKARLAETNSQFVSYLALISIRYSSWHSELIQYENKTVAWAEGQFAPLVESVQNLNLSSDRAYEIAGQDEELSLKMKTSIETCFEQSEKRDLALSELEKYQLMGSEHITSGADFLSQMSQRLNADVSAWSVYDGQKKFIHQGYFSHLVRDSEIFSESVHLMTENAGYVEAQFNRFVELAAALL